MRHHVGFGTVLGYHTVAELNDLMAAKDATVHNLVEEFSEVKDLPLDLTTFEPAYYALLNRYSAARAIAQQAVTEAGKSSRPSNTILADNEYKGLLSSLNSRWQEYTWSPGDGSIEDLFDQLKGFGATGANNVPIPQPSAGSDADFNLLASASRIIHTLESSVDKKHLVIYALVGGTVGLIALSMSPAGIMLRRR